LQIVRPYSSHAPSEIVSAPKVYGFDTGFVCHYRGWNQLRREDYGHLFEHIVLNEILARFPKAKMRYWRDKAKHEVDFIYTKNRHQIPIAIECKWSANNFNGKNINRFRKLHPEGENYVVATDVDKPYTRQIADIYLSRMNFRDYVWLFFARGNV